MSKIMKNVKEIWIEAENWEQGQWDIKDDNTDVIVTFEDGSKFIATFFTYKNITSLVENYKRTGECLNGKFFHATDMILIDRCSRDDIEQVIIHLIREEEFEEVFTKIIE